MKKCLVICLTLLVMLVMVGTALAAEDSFDNVPADDWSYEAVAQLAQAGLIDGYDKNSFPKKKVITRYEMALIIAKALDNSVKADGKNVALINKLAATYEPELKDLGVRIAKLEAQVEKNKRGDKIIFQQDIYYTYTNSGQDNASYKKYYSGTSGYYQYFKGKEIKPYWIYSMEPSYKVDDTWTVNLGTFYSSRLHDGGTRGFLYYGEFNVAGNFAGGNITVGAFSDYMSQNGILMYSHVNGVKYFFGNKVKAAFSSGKIDTYGNGVNYSNMGHTYYAALAFNYGLHGASGAPGKATNATEASTADILAKGEDQVTGAVVHLWSPSPEYEPRNFFELGYIRGLTNHLTFNVDGLRSDHVPFGNTGWMASLTTDSGQSGAGGYKELTVSYSRMGANCIIGNNETVKDYGYDTNTAKNLYYGTKYSTKYLLATNGMKGLDVSLDYYIERYVKLTLEYAYGKPMMGNDYNNYRFFMIKCDWSVR